MKKDDYIKTLTSEEKKLFIEAIYVLAISGAPLNSGEAEYIKNLSKTYEISPEELKNVFANTSTEAVFQKMKYIQDEVKILELLRQMFFMINIDREVLDQEIDFVVELANNCSIDLEVVKAVNNWVSDYLILEEQEKIIFS